MEGLLKSSDEYIEITDEIIHEINFHRRRTGIGPQRLLRGKSQTMPKGLSSTLIYNWINGKSKTVKKDHLEFVIKSYQKFPNYDKPIMRNPNYKEGLEAIPIEALNKLKIIKDNTGLLPSKIFEIYPNAPKYLNSQIVGNWINIEGYKGRKEDVDWVLKTCRKLLKKTISKIDVN